MILANVAAAETLEHARAAADLSRARRAVAGEGRGAAAVPARRCTSRCRRAARCAPSSSTASSPGCNGRDVEKLVNEVVLRSAGAGRICGRELRPFRPQPAPLRALHLADPPLRRPDRASRPDPRARASAPTACPRARTLRALGEIAAQISATERRAMKAERETVDRLIAHFLADRIGATFDGHISGVTRAGLFVKLDETGADGFVPARTIGARIFPLRGGDARHGRQPQRRDPPARRPRHGEARRGRAGRRRAALRAAVRRPRDAAPPQRAHPRARTARRGTSADAASESAIAESAGR